MQIRQKISITEYYRQDFYQFLLFSLFAFVCIYGVQWWIFIVLVFVNVVADILGGYNGYLSMSINTRLVRKEQLSEALAFISSINNTISLAGKAVGVFVFRAFKLQLLILWYVKCSAILDSIF